MATLDLILGYDCNLWCDYCTISAEMRERALSTAEVVRGLRSAREEGFNKVSFTGGEPTIRADLLPLVREASRLGYEEIKLQTNGLVLATKANLDRLLDAGVTRIHVSVHTHERDAYEELVQREATHQHMEAALRHLIEAPIELNADIILKRDTACRIVDTVDWLVSLGVRSMLLWYVSLTDANRDRIDSLPRMTDVVDVVREAMRHAQAAGVSLRSLHMPLCLLGDMAEHTHNPAAARVRVVTPEATFELSESRLTPNVHVAACDGCKERERCPGLRRDYLEVYGDAEVAAARGQDASVKPTRLPVVD